MGILTERHRNCVILFHCYEIVCFWVGVLSLWLIIHQNEVIIVWMEGSRWACTISAQKPRAPFKAPFKDGSVHSLCPASFLRPPAGLFLPLWTLVVMFHCERTYIGHTPLPNWGKTTLETCLTLIWFLVSNREPVGLTMTPEPLKVSSCEILGMHKKIFKKVLCLIMSYRT